MGQQRFHFGPQLRIVTAGRVQQRCALLRRRSGGPGEDLLDSLPAFAGGRHLVVHAGPALLPDDSTTPVAMRAGTMRAAVGYMAIPGSTARYPNPAPPCGAVPPLARCVLIARAASLRIPI